MHAGDLILGGPPLGPPPHFLAGPGTSFQPVEQSSTCNTLSLVTVLSMNVISLNLEMTYTSFMI